MAEIKRSIGGFTGLDLDGMGPEEQVWFHLYYKGLRLRVGVNP